MNSHSYLVEFVGTSGVGKTTLCNYFLKKRSKELAVTSKLKIFSKKDIILSPEPNNNLDEIYELLFLKKLKYYGNLELANGTNKYKRIISSYRTLKKDQVYIQGGLQQSILVLDQHLMHPYGDILCESLEELRIKNFFKNRLFVFCYADAERVLHHHKLRADKGKTRTIHRNYNQEELRTIIQSGLQRRRKQIETIKECGGSVLEVNTGDDMGKNAENILKFLKENIKSQ